MGRTFSTCVRCKRNFRVNKTVTYKHSNGRTYTTVRHMPRKYCDEYCREKARNGS